MTILEQETNQNETTERSESSGINACNAGIYADLKVFDACRGSANDVSKLGFPQLDIGPADERNQTATKPNQYPAETHNRPSNGLPGREKQNQHQGQGAGNDVSHSPNKSADDIGPGPKEIEAQRVKDLIVKGMKSLMNHNDRPVDIDVKNHNTCPEEVNQNKLPVERGPENEMKMPSRLDFPKCEQTSASDTHASDSRMTGKDGCVPQPGNADKAIDPAVNPRVDDINMEEKGLPHMKKTTRTHQESGVAERIMNSDSHSDLRSDPEKRVPQAPMPRVKVRGALL